MAIYEHNSENETLWGKGKHQAMIKTPNVDRPFGYCDGTDEDEQSLVAMAESEGLERVHIDRRRLKTGREIWTVRGEGGQEEDTSNQEWSD